MDYAFLFGMPVLFLAIAWFGITSLIGPAPPTRPVKMIREGAVTVGMSESAVYDKLGMPKDIERSPDGTYAFVYHQGTSEPFVEDEAAIVFSSSGVVTRINIQKATVTPAEDK